MNDSRQTNGAAILAGILSNQMRFAIVKRLIEGPCQVGRLSEAVGNPQAVVSKQLALLRDSGLLVCRPEGRWREYALANPEEVSKLVFALEAAAVAAGANAKNCRKMADRPDKEKIDA